MAMADSVDYRTGGLDPILRAGRLRRMGRLVVCLVAIWVFMLHLVPLMDRLPLVAPIVAFIDERGIEANMYFYTEVEEFSEAGLNMDNTMKYMPADTPTGD